MYKELIQELSRETADVKFQPPCSETELEFAERVVGYPFPEELKALLRETNGDGWCILSTRRIVENVAGNRAIFLPDFEADGRRELYFETVDRFLFFATNGCGDYYCYRARPDGTVDDTVIYLWEHEDLGEDCCWRPVASSLTEFLTRYYTDEI